MPNISLPTGNVIYISVYEYFFLLKEEDVDEFYQQLIADNAGVPAPEDPFSNCSAKGRLEIEDVPDIEEPSIERESD
jgi:hypothetical protein